MSTLDAAGRRQSIRETITIVEKELANAERLSREYGQIYNSNKDAGLKPPSGTYAAWKHWLQRRHELVITAARLRDLL